MDIINKIKKGDSEAFELLLEQHRKLIYKIINRFILENGDYQLDVEDLFQEGSLALYNACFSYKEEFGVKFSTFAYSFIKKRLSVRYRDTFVKRRFEYFSLDAVENVDYLSFAYVKEDAVEYCREKQFEEYLNKFIEKLPQEEQMILKLRREDYSYKEIAKRLKINTKRIDNKLFSLRKKLRAYLENEKF